MLRFQRPETLSRRQHLPNDLPRYLHEQLVTGQLKYAYYILAIAAAAIALALNRTVGQPLMVGHLILGVSVASWAVSFYYGCEYILDYMALLRVNAEALSAPVGQRAADAMAAGLLDDKARSVGRHLGRQFRWLVAGAACYVLWHLLGMALCTPSLADDLSRLGGCASAGATVRR